MYYLNVYYYTKPGLRGAFLTEIKKLGIDKLCRAEDGCIKYDYYFADDNEDELLLIELWQTENHQQAHTLTPHTKQLQQLKQKYVERTEIKAFLQE